MIENRGLAFSSGYNLNYCDKNSSSLVCLVFEIMLFLLLSKCL